MRRFQLQPPFQSISPTMHYARLFTPFHFISTQNSNYYLHLFAKKSYQEWQAVGFDPVKFIQQPSLREVSVGSGNLLMRLLCEYCRMIIADCAPKMDPKFQARANKFAEGILQEITYEAKSGFDKIHYRGPNGENDLGDLFAFGEMLMADLAANNVTLRQACVKNIFDFFHLLLDRVFA